MLIALYPLAMAIAGALVFATASGPVAKELGRLTYFAGIVVLAYTLASRTFHLG